MQRNLLARFHVTDPGEFFNGSDFWEVPNTPDAPDTGVKQPPYYLLTQFPEQNEPRFQITSAVTPLGRQNLAALISGSYVDGKPQLQVWELPDQTAVQGPVQVHQRMTNTNAQIRQDLNLLSSNQAQVLYGNLLSLPFGGGMLYVEPVYVKSNQENAYPVLQKVLMSYGDGGSYVVLANTLQEGIKELVDQGKQGAAPPPPEGENPPQQPPAGSGQQLTPELAAAADKVEAAWAEVKAARAAGDFEREGKALKAFDDAMAEFQSALDAANRPSGNTATPTPSATATPPPASPSPTPGGG
ncbi:hypothetical protein Phou_029450 [Phytohabitans houttuyneae]|uniref:Uncharacterized protein n=1 Tax=Phytohabitans houttuyneae TaxID=1076126 RepID=A0A6V8KDF2_9ACTN|nr:hypothetical protein Phou_029450 [Phytohabitans houttuyneae]